MRDRGDEGELFAIRTERETAHVHVDRVELGRGAAVKADRIKLAPRLFVIRLVHVQRNKINLRTIFRPNDVAFIEAPECHLLRLHFFIRIPRRLDCPDVSRMFWVGVAFVVFAIDRARDHADVALMF